MNRRHFLATAAAVPNALAATAQTAHPGQTHVDSKLGGPALKSAVVKSKGLSVDGDAPGAKVKVNFNGPTGQLTALATGACMLDPGAKPHPPHRHPEEEVMIIASGTGEFFLEGVTTKVETGDMLYAEANVLHGIVNTGSTPMTFYFTKMMAKKA